MTKDEVYKEKECFTLSSVRLERVVKAIRKASEVNLAVKDPTVIDANSGQIYQT